MCDEVYKCSRTSMCTFSSSFSFRKTKGHSSSSFCHDFSCHDLFILSPIIQRLFSNTSSSTSTLFFPMVLNLMYLLKILLAWRNKWSVVLTEWVLLVLFMSKHWQCVVQWKSKCWNSCRYLLAHISRYCFSCTCDTSGCACQPRYPISPSSPLSLNIPSIVSIIATWIAFSSSSWPFSWKNYWNSIT